MLKKKNQEIGRRFKDISPKKTCEVKLLSRVQLFVTPWTVAYQLLHPGDFPGKNTGVGCHFLLQPKKIKL